MFESMSQTRRIKFQVAGKTTEQLIDTRTRLLNSNRDGFQDNLLSVIEEELKRRPDFLPVR